MVPTDLSIIDLLNVFYDQSIIFHRLSNRILIKGVEDDLIWKGFDELSESVP